MKKQVETYVMVEGNLMDASLQPSQSELQGAFVAGKGKTPSIVIDMTVAKEIAKDMVRQARTSAFAKNDADTMMAMQRGDNAGLEAARKKGDFLRNASKDERISKAKTPDELLKAVEDITAEF